MKILQLCKKFPFPLKDGESIAVTYMSKALNELGCEITLLAMNTVKHYYDLKQLPKSFNHYKSIQTARIDNRVKPKDAFLNLFSEDSYHIARFISDDFRRKLIQLLRNNKYDIIQLETLYLAPYISTIRKYSDAKIAMRSHNVEHEIWERIATNTSFFPKKWYLKHLTEKLRKFEINQLNNYDILVGITQRDLDYFKKLGFKNKGVVAPIGLDMGKYQPQYQSFEKPISLSFIGSLDWMPNLEGLEWFIQKVMPSIRKQYPNIKLHIAGRNMPSSLQNLKVKNIVVHGEVESSTEFLNQHSVMIVPLFSGSGMRAKILEAMALGKVVITTPLGLEGINASNQKEVLLAKDETTFMTQLESCVKNQSSLVQIGQNARKFIENQYDYHSVSKRLMEFYESQIFTPKPVES